MEVQRMLINFRPLCANKLKSLSQARIFRTGDLLHVDEHDVEQLRTTYHISHYLDLRSHTEVKQKAINDKLVDSKIVYRHFPMQDEGHYLRKTKFPDGKDYFNYYAHLLENNKVSIKEFLIYVNEISSFAFMYGCYAGKDRTGVISILLMYLTGLFNDSDIVEDYILSGVMLRKDIGYFQSTWEKKQLSKDQYIERLTPHSETANLIINHLNEQYGGVNGYLSYLDLLETDLTRLNTLFRRIYHVE